MKKLVIKKEEIIKHSRDPLHINLCEKYPSRVVERKKFKKEKYKKKYEDEE